MIRKNNSSFDTMRMLGTASSFAMCMALAQPAFAQDAQEEDAAQDAEGADAPPPEAQDARVPIFHETDHVRTFYRLARD